VTASTQLALFEPEEPPGHVAALAALRRVRGLQAPGNGTPARTVRDPAALRPQPARDGPDFWPTPQCLAVALAQFVLPEVSGAIWEPAAGDGRLATAMRDVGRDVLASDIQPRGDGIEQCDFLHDDPPFEARGRCIVTNPPFRLLDRFLIRGLQLLDLGTAISLVLLLRSDAVSAGCRAQALNRASFEFACAWRPVWLPGTQGGGRWSNSWIVWIAGRQGPPITRRLRRQDIAP
jgi:hypothetical protein